MRVIRVDGSVVYQTQTSGRQRVRLAEMLVEYLASKPSKRGWRYGTGHGNAGAMWADIDFETGDWVVWEKPPGSGAPYVCMRAETGDALEKIVRLIAGKPPMAWRLTREAIRQEAQEMSGQPRDRGVGFGRGFWLGVGLGLALSVLALLGRT